jgi:hypothetical protein
MKALSTSREKISRYTPVEVRGQQGKVPARAGCRTRRPGGGDLPSLPTERVLVEAVTVRRQAELLSSDCHHNSPDAYKRLTTWPESKMPRMSLIFS